MPDFLHPSTTRGKPEDQWSSPINMGPEINSATGNEWSAGLSPDGRFLFLMKSLKDDSFSDIPVTMENIRRIAASPQNGDADIYWIRSDFIDRLKNPDPEQSNSI